MFKLYCIQVWAGTEACEPVTWQECKLVPKDVKFIVPEIKCEPKQELWYHEPEEVTLSKITFKVQIVTLTCHPGERDGDDEHVHVQDGEHHGLQVGDEARLQGHLLAGVQVSH